MIDLDKLESRCKKVSRDGDGKHPVIASTESIMELISRLRYAESETCALLSMLRHAEKDAARYRWLRDEAIEHQDSGPLIIFSDFNGEPCSFGDCGSIISHDDADKAIDEAMQCK